MNEKNLIAIVTEITKELAICAKRLGIIEECPGGNDCDKCITMCLTKEEEETEKTEVDSTTAKYEFMKKLYDFFITWNRTTLVVFYDGVEEFLSIRDEAEIEDTIDFLCELCENFSEEAIITVNEEFSGTEETFYDCFGDICDIYAR